MRRVGLALGGGGVRGLAHILVLELLDELKLKPCIIAGTSIGAIVGSLYASGMSGKAIHALVSKYFRAEDEPLRRVLRRRAELLRWVGPRAARFGRGGGFAPDRFLRHLLDAVSKNTFEELDIMQSAALATKMKSRPPDIYVRPQVGNIRILDFAKAEEVFAHAGPAIEDLRSQLAQRGLASKKPPRGTTPRARM